MSLYTSEEIIQKINSFLQIHENGVIEILGPTASGKTKFSIELAQKIPGILQKNASDKTKNFKRGAEILSVDSKQIYIDIDISSGKVLKKEMKGVIHHGINIIKPTEEYNVYQFQKFGFKTIKEILFSNNIPILCGGTMLWLDAISENYVFSEKGTKSQEKNTPAYPILKIGIKWPREELYERINLRSKIMFESGLIEETQKILKKYPKIHKSAFTSFGYKEVGDFLEGKITQEEALALNQQKNRKYAKKQSTWWRGREDIFWVDGRGI